MVFHRSLIVSKFLQVSRILLSILAVPNNVVVWIVSTRPLISKSSSPFNNPLVTVPIALIVIGIIVTFMFHIFFFFVFQFPSKVEVLVLLFILFWFYSIVSRSSKVNNFASSLFFFFVNYYKVWSSGRDWVICLFVKVPLEFMCVIIIIITIIIDLKFQSFYLTFSICHNYIVRTICLPFGSKFSECY